MALAGPAVALEDPRRIVAVVGAGWIGLNAVALNHSSSDLAVGIVMAQIIGLVGGGLTYLAARRTETPLVVRVVVLAWVAKLFGTAARYYVLEVTYGGQGDANRYAAVGEILAQRFRAGDIAPYSSTKNLLGTQLIEMLTGGLFTVTGPTIVGGFYVYSALGFVGTYLTFRALRMRLPDASPLRLALLGFGLPSMLFWPSSIGKEAVMVLAVGLTVYGAARWWSGLLGGIPCVAGGMVLSALVRPHVTVLLGAGLVGAVLLVRSEPSAGDLFLKLIRTTLFVGALGVAVAVSSSFFRLDEVDAAGVTSVLDRAEERSDDGGSSYSTGNPLLFPLAAVTVLYRPFPWEAGNLQSAIASAEGTLLLVLTIARRRHLWALMGQVRDRPMVAFTLVYGTTFIIAFSQLANFGILARQRVQLYPLIIGLLCVDAVTGSRTAGDPADDDRALAVVS